MKLPREAGSLSPTGVQWYLPCSCPSLPTKSSVRRTTEGKARTTYQGLLPET